MQSMFYFIPNVFSRVEVKALYWPLELFHFRLDKPCLYKPRFVHRGHCHAGTGLGSLVPVEKNITILEHIKTACTIVYSLGKNHVCPQTFGHTA